MDELVYTWDEFFTDANKLAALIAPNKPQSLIVVTKRRHVFGRDAESTSEHFNY
jgi:hypothetical protein